jgi:small-conductance mechanosensitive channel
MQALLVGILSPWVKGPMVFVAWCVGLIVVMRVIYRHLKRFSRRTRTHLDDIILNALSIPLVIIILVSGGFILSRMFPHAPAWDRGLNLAVKVLVIVAGVVFADRLAKSFLKYYSDRIEYLKESSGIIQTAVRAVVVLVALLIVLETAGVAITPLIASLGVGSLALALALQAPLSNFFAGLQIVADKPVQMGQYIRLSTGEEGRVTKIGWRSTAITSPANNTVIIPNAKIVDAIITNYDLPERETSIVIKLGVHLESDLERVEQVTREVAREVLLEVEGGKKDYEPLIRYSGFGDSTVEFNVILRAEEFTNSYLLKHELVKRLHRRYRGEGIVIPYPTRSLDVKREDLLLLKEDSTS